MSTHTTASLPFDAATVEFDPLLRRLNLASTRRHWRELLQRAETHGWSCREFLGVLVTEEIAHRQHTRVQRAVRQARFPFLKTIEEFDFSLQSSLRLPLLGSYLAPELVTGGLSLILKGKSGRGKTHLAIAIAYRAIQQGFTARFVTAAALIEELSSASRQGKLQAVLTAYLNPNVLIVDEVGYLSYGPDAANVLFHVVNERHLRGRSMLFTTNKSPLTAWGAVLHDADLAEAIVDRILERGRLMLLDGPSYRTQHLDLDVLRCMSISASLSPDSVCCRYTRLAADGNRRLRRANRSGSSLTRVSSSRASSIAPPLKGSDDASNECSLSYLVIARSHCSSVISSIAICRWGGHGAGENTARFLDPLGEPSREFAEVTLCAMAAEFCWNR